MTGAGGFVGANLARRLVADGHEVTCTVRPGSDHWRLEAVADSCEIAECDLTDDAALTQLVAARGPHWVFHLAAHGAYSWQDDVGRILATNLGATVALARACAETGGCEAIVHAGSSSEYGYKDHPPAESELPEPNSEYAVAKVAATQFLRFIAQSGGPRTVTLRLYSVYGPWEEPNRLIPTLAEHGLRGELPELVGPDTARDFVYVDDVCEAFIAAASRTGSEPGAVYNVGSGTQVTIAEAVAAAIDELDIGAEPSYGSMPSRRWDTSVWVADPQRIRAELGWTATTGFAEGFARFVAWLRSGEAPVDRYGLAPA